MMVPVAAGRPISRLALLVDLLQRLETGYETAVSGQSPQPAWNRRLVTLGKQVALDRGAQFAIREGGLTVGAGVITDILE